MTTSRGLLLERLFQIGTLECTISHDIETLQFLQSDLKEKEETLSLLKEEESDYYELENEVDSLSFEIEKRQEIVAETTELRREIMKTLDGLGERDWCPCKHYAEAVQRSLEIYESTYSKEDYEILVKTYKIWAARLSLYFGIQYTTCFRCLSDKLKK